MFAIDQQQIIIADDILLQAIILSLIKIIQVNITMEKQKLAELVMQKMKEKKEL